MVERELQAYALLDRNEPAHARAQRAVGGRARRPGGAACASRRRLFEPAGEADEGGDLGCGRGAEYLARGRRRRRSGRRAGRGRGRRAPRPRRDRGRPRGWRAARRAAPRRRRRAARRGSARRGRRTARRAAATSGSSASARARCTRRASPPDSARGRPLRQVRPRPSRAARPSARSRRSRARNAPPAQRRLDVGARRAVGERRRLQRGGHAAVPLDGAARRPEQTRERGEQRRLARAVGAEDGRATSPARSVEVDIAHHHRPGHARTRERRAPRSSGSLTTGGRAAPARRRCCSTRERGGEQQHEAEQDRCRARSRAPYSPAETRTSTALASVCVSPSMLPPTSTTAPTSANAEPDRGDRRREHADARLAQREHGDRGARGAERARLVEQPVGQRLHGRGGERGDDREREHRLGEDHAVERVEQVEARRAARRGTAAARRRGRRSRAAAPCRRWRAPAPAARPRKRPRPEREAERQADGEREQRRPERHPQRDADDAEHLVVAAERAGRPPARSPSQRNSTSGLLGVDEPPVGEPVDAADPLALARRPARRARAAGAAAVSPRLVIIVWPSGPGAHDGDVAAREHALRSSDASAASRNATASTTPRSKRLTSPSSGSPLAVAVHAARAGRTRLLTASASQRGRDELEVGEVLAVEPVAHERDRERDARRRAGRAR